MSAIAHASAKLSVVRGAIATVGVANTLRLECSRVIDRFAIASIRPIFTLSLPNNKHKLHLRTGTSDYNVFLHVFSRQIYAPALTQRYVPRLIIDCGANVGYSSAYFLNRFPAVNIIAIEPDPANFAICEMNLAPYGSRVILLNSAAWSKPRSLELVRHGPHLEHATQVRESTGLGSARVPAVDISTLIELGGGATVDLLKLDIEGSELELFNENSHTWLPRVKNIAIELHGTRCRDAFFRALDDYEFEQINSGDTTICRNIGVRY